MKLCVLAFTALLTAMPVIAQNPSSSAQMSTGNASSVEPPVHPATEDQIREYLSLNGTAKNSRTLMAQMVKAMHATSVPYLPQSFWDDLDAEFQKVDLVAVCVPIYQKYLSQEDMAEIVKFYRTPAGQRILATQTDIQRDASVVLQKAAAEIGEHVYLRHKDEIDAAKKKYDASQAAPVQK